MKPYEQGGLDGLCGVYSIINASNIINNLTDDDCEELFKEILVYLDREKSLSRILTEGLNINVLGEILKNIKSLNFNRAMPFKGSPETSLSDFWEGIQEFLTQPNRAVLLGMAGQYDHWSIIKSISDKRINFCDSDGIKYFNRSACTTQEPDKKRKHQIMPTHTYFLSLK
jgi:hypothetical protein